MIMPVSNFDWLEFEERVHPLLWARGHSSTSITSGKIVIYCLKTFLIPTFWPPSSFCIFSLKYSIFVIFRVLINNDFITVYIYFMWDFFYLPTFANCQVVYSNSIMSVYHLKQLFLIEDLLTNETYILC